MGIMNRPLNRVSIENMGGKNPSSSILCTQIFQAEPKLNLDRLQSAYYWSVEASNWWDASFSGFSIQQDWRDGFFTIFPRKNTFLQLNYLVKLCFHP
jgi:hypothetical protein